ncbi:glutathione S-transferase family protein [Roseomonas marmotae]|uniref:Glutathione S-transferase N-terminal domain-containing protein n=1 Tax=Roseomonas marmotae TaxID=2768161 RepID=A0ABS3K9D4_9PROT|nr:glutathione S-transferase N-terminal domain-containing protein [Roseomonas marmotae]MBO1074055.1 glutathione S-transferase N-terminal domain-containing protein [Roseomonas marmotae]QTI78841.1 glutathione S-transferase N-terminal domain-containing protein [Roseomonas marmotae]
MKLYYSPGACSVGIHVILEETGKPYELELVSLKDQAQNTPEFRAVNPKGKVPVLVRDTGAPLTEFTAIAFYLGARFPEAKLLPAELEAQADTLSFVDYIAGTVHPQAFTRQFRASRFTPNPADEPKVVEQGKALAAEYLGLIDQNWKGETWVMPQGYSIADASLFFVEYWAVKRVGMPVPARIEAHLKAMLERPAVQRALTASGMAA